MRLKLSYGLIKAKGLINERCHLLSIAKQNRLENADKLRWIVAVIEIIKYALLQLRVNILRDRNVFGLSLFLSLFLALSLIFSVKYTPYNGEQKHGIACRLHERLNASAN